LRPGTIVAIKIIPKDKVTNINAVMRVEKELRALIELKGAHSCFFFPKVVVIIFRKSWKVNS
jgi:hypothetical protein